MSISFILVCVWLVVANVSAMLPLRGNHWPMAYFLITVGIPILGYVTYQNGPLFGVISLAAGASVLRWPLIYLTRWIKRLVRREAD